MFRSENLFVQQECSTNVEYPQLGRHPSRLETVRIVRKYIDKILTDPDVTDSDLFLRNLVAYLTNKPAPLGKTEEEEELARLQNALQELKAQHEAQLRSALEQLEGARNKVAGDTVATSASEKSA